MKKNQVAAPCRLKDLAAELGVSVSTVSRALKNSPEIGEEMRARIKALAKERNYRANPLRSVYLKTPCVLLVSSYPIL